MSPAQSPVRAPARLRRPIKTSKAWAGPAVVVATPAPTFAASAPPVAVETLWASDAYSRTSSMSGTYTVPPSGGTDRGRGMTVRVSSSFGSNMRAGSQYDSTDNDNLWGFAQTRGGLYTNTLALHQSPWSNTAKSTGPTLANSQTVTFDFSRPVTGLRFAITDIDALADNYIDHVDVTGTVSPKITLNDPTFTTQSGHGVRPLSTSQDIDDATSPRGNVSYSFSGEVSQVKVTYYNVTASYDPSIDSDQNIYISPMAFTYTPT